MHAVFKVLAVLALIIGTAMGYGAPINLVNNATAVNLFKMMVNEDEGALGLNDKLATGHNWETETAGKTVGGFEYSDVYDLTNTLRTVGQSLVPVGKTSAIKGRYSTEGRLFIQP